MKKKITAKYNKTRLNKYTTCISFGSASELEGDDIQINNTIDEYTFYYLYCTIQNITAKDPIPDSQIMLLATIMCKPLDWNLPVDSKDGKLKQIASELSFDGQEKSPNSIYQALKRLKDKNYLVEMEDKLIVLNSNFQNVRQAVKRQLNENGVACLDYLFKCYISNER